MRAQVLDGNFHGRARIMDVRVLVGSDVWQGFMRGHAVGGGRSGACGIVGAGDAAGRGRWWLMI